MLSINNKKIVVNKEDFVAVTTYWQQFSRKELDEMHGVLCEPFDEDQFFDFCDEEEMRVSRVRCECGNCMWCLGLTW